MYFTWIKVKKCLKHQKEGTDNKKLNYHHIFYTSNGQAVSIMDLQSMSFNQRSSKIINYTYDYDYDYNSDSESKSKLKL